VKVFILKQVSTCFAVSIESLFTFQEDCKRFKGITSWEALSLSLSFFLPSFFYLTISHFFRVYLSTRCEKGDYFERRAKKIASERSTHTDTSSRYALYIVCDNRCACLSHTAYTYTQACVSLHLQE